jgi:hypothetical protein
VYVCVSKSAIHAKVDSNGIQRDAVEAADCEFFTNLLREQCQMNCNPGA